MLSPYAKRRTRIAALTLSALAALINTRADAWEDALPACEQVPETAPDPSQPPPPPPEIKPTTIATIGEAYFCIFEHYVGGPVLDDRALLVPAFVGFTQELQRRGLDQSKATPPAFSGKRSSDWVAFRRAYQAINATLPQDPAIREAVAEAAMRTMVNALNDDHVSWVSGRRPELATLGLTLSGFRGPGQKIFDPGATGPFFITAVQPRSPAESGGVLAGDEIVAINGVTPYVNARLNEGALSLITSPPMGTPVTLTLHRPATDAVLTIELTAQGVPQPPPSDGARLVNGNIAYAKLLGFADDSAKKILSDVRDLAKATHLRGLILDLRGNGGGSGSAGALLLGSFVHNRVTDYWCTLEPIGERCTPNHSDDSVPLLNLPLVVLVDRICASACDAFSSTVKDLHLGTLVGSRTAGVVSGPADLYSLQNGSSIWLPAFRQLGANKEPIDTIGVAPDYFAPLTAAELSAAHDPGLAKALELLH